MTRTALELVGQSGFGYSFDALEEGTKEHPFAASLKGLTYVAIIRGLLGNCLLTRLLESQWRHKRGPSYDCASLNPPLRRFDLAKDSANYTGHSPMERNAHHQGYGGCHDQHLVRDL
jgi:hypothetical protein